MIKEQAESVKDLAKDTVEALGVVTERECSNAECDGGTILTLNALEPSKCPVCSGTGKVSWKWEPKVGEWVFTPCVLNKNEPVLIISVDKIGFHYAIEDDEDFCSVQTYSRCIPILPWEEIERVLEKAKWTKFAFSLRDSDGKLQANSNKMLSNGNCSGVGKSRQEAVMRAVIKLGEIQ